MKNIHLIPTDKPSSLFEIDGHLIINKEQLIQPKYYRNIYITNDEDINENDYIITKDGRLVQVSYLLSKDLEEASKVILTTDHDLFKDGVQAINDEFHDWFVKNPSCEFVKTKLVYDYEEHPELVGNPKEEWSYYNIIIPQEEPNKETLEEAGERLFNEVYGGITSVSAFIKGAKWQAERMYSEEDMEEYSEFCIRCYQKELPCIIAKDWFEQFKKTKYGK
jgi:hypothetical protein